jgi:hypothetical protein
VDEELGCGVSGVDGPLCLGDCNGDSGIVVMYLLASSGKVILLSLDNV